MTTQSLAPSKIRKVIVQLVAGAVTGGLVSYFAFSFFEGRGIDIDDPTRVVALGVGLVFALMGLAVGLGALAPNAGAKFLNVQDAEELDEQKVQLRSGAVIFILTGAAVLVLALSDATGTPGLLGGQAAGIVAALCFAGVAWASIASRKATDELMLQVGREASTLALYLAVIGAAVWAVVAQYRPAGAVGPLALLSGLLLLSFVSIMLVAGRRGLLNPR